MTSAPRIVDSRCAIAIVVRPCMTVSSASCTSRSLVVSSADVASSRISTARVLEDHPGDRQPLLLAAGQPVAALADDRVVALVEAHDPVVDVRGARRRLELGVRSRRRGVPQVLADRGVEQVGVLRDHADRVGQARQRQVADVVAVERDRARAATS